jgi:hypothetical protein
VVTREIPATVHFPAIPSPDKYRAKYQEAHEGREPTCTGMDDLKLVPWCFGSGENSRKYRDGDDAIVKVAVVSDNLEDEGI